MVGRTFERLVQSVKRCLKKVLGKSRLSLEEITTLIVEIENVLNCRPLTYVYTDELQEALTPSHLIYGRRLLSLPSLDESLRFNQELLDMNSELLQCRKDYLLQILKHYWKRWHGEYLKELREHHSITRSKDFIAVSEGDIVLIQEETLQPRSVWNLGRIESLIKGKDGQIRGAVVRTVSKGNKSQYLRRPVNKLYPLEVGNTAVKNEIEQIELKPRRRAAVEGELKRKLLDLANKR